MLNIISLYALPVIILTILVWGLIKKVPVYEEFVEGAKDGFKVAVNIIPYLIAIIVGISMFKASGALDMPASFFAPLLDKFSIPPDSLPVMIVRSLSGTAVLGLFGEIVSKYGTDSYITMLCAVITGSSETTFYVLSVYFGSIGITKYRYALLAGLIGDAIGILAAILVCKQVFLPNIA